jgi:hypothetical protein
MLDKHEYIKITNAVYKILDYFPEGDPLKNKAKEKALAILEQVTVGTFSVELLNDVEVLKSYLSLARYQGFVNDMNFLIITKEYDQIKNQFASLEAQKKSVDILEKEIALHTVRKEDKPEPEKKPETHQVVAPKIAGSSLKAVNRQKKILDILSGRQKTQVADIIKELPEVTKRTVRRDLDDLLKEGKVLRFGEWNQVFYQISS